MLHHSKLAVNETDGVAPVTCCAGFFVLRSNGTQKGGDGSLREIIRRFVGVSGAKRRHNIGRSPTSQ